MCDFSAAARRVDIDILMTRGNLSHSCKTYHDYIYYTVESIIERGG